MPKKVAFQIQIKEHKGDIGKAKNQKYPDLKKEVNKQIENNQNSHKAYHEAIIKIFRVPEPI